MDHHFELQVASFPDLTESEEVRFFFDWSMTNALKKKIHIPIYSHDSYTRMDVQLEL